MEEHQLTSPSEKIVNISERIHSAKGVLTFQKCV